MHDLAEGAANEPFPPAVQVLLSQDAADEMVEIKPNGAIYVPHTIYRDVLDRAFGIGGWALIPLEPPRIKGDRAIWYGYLKAGGRYIESAYGGCTYVPKNKEMNEDDAVEGAKSDCITRCCKALPLFRNVANRDYAEAWRARYAYQVENPNYPGRRQWKKKGVPMAGIEGKPGVGHQSEYRRVETVRQAQNAHVEAIAREGTLRTLALQTDEDMGREPDEWEVE